MIYQGEVYDYQGGRVVVVSSDRVNVDAYPIVVRLGRRDADEPPYLIATAEFDPITGSIDVPLISFANPDKMSGPVCTLSGDTVNRLLNAVRDLFDPN